MASNEQHRGRMIGEKIDEYEIKKAIGKGGMGSVYRAYQPSVDRYVAIKVLPNQESEDPSYLKRFQHEARVIARLEHRSILPVYAYGEHNGRPYLVMRLLEAGSLRRKMFYEDLSLPVIARIVEQVGEALDYAHEQGIVHRDLKPSNILLDEHNNAYLTDFGIARMLGSTTQITAEGVVGTPSYMSPEQCRGKEATPASDIYALGAILFELVTGKPPFEADTPLAVMYLQVREPVPSVQSVDPELPGEIDRVVQRAMAKDPANRYRTAQAFAADLWQAVGMHSVQRTPSAASSRERRQQQVEGISQRSAQRRAEREAQSEGRGTLFKIGIIAFVVLVSAIGAGFAVSGWLGGGAAPPPTDSPTATPATDGGALTPGDLGPIVSEPTDSGVIVEPAGSDASPTPLPVTPTLPPTPTPVPPSTEFGPGQLVFTVGTNSTAEIAVIGVDNGAQRLITDNSFYDGEPDWSPDGAQIVFESSRDRNMDVYVMAANGDNLRRLTTSPQPDRHPDWSPDGTLIAYESGVGNSSEIYVMNADGTGQTRLTDNGVGDRAPHFSPDGTLIAYMTVERGRWEIAVMRYPSGAPVSIFDCPDADCRFPTWAPDGRTIVYNTLTDQGDVDAIWSVDVRTGNSRMLIEEGENGRPVYDANADSLFFNRTVESITGLYRYDVGTGEIFRLTDGEQDEYAPDWGSG